MTTGLIEPTIQKEKPVFMARRARIFAIACVLAVASACSGGEKPQPQTSPFPSPIVSSVDITTEDATPSEDPTPSPTVSAEEVDMTQGLVVASCETDGDTRINVERVDLATGEILRTISYELRRGTDKYQSNGLCGASAMRAGYNVDFTQLFVSERDSALGSTVVKALSPDGTVVQLSKTADTFTRVVDESPSFHTGTGRVYYWNKAGKKPVLMSMTADGGDVTEEKVLQKSATTSSDLAMPDTMPPIIDTPGSDRVYGHDGSTSAYFTSATTLTITERDRRRVVKVDTKGFAKRPTLIGFSGSDAVVMTDGQSIYRADVTGSTADMTPLVTNTTGNKVVNAMVSKDGTQIAFTFFAGKSTLYTLPVSGGEEPRELPVQLGSSTQLLQFN